MIESCKAAKKAGLDSHITIMFGYPWESKEDAQRTLDLGKFLLKKQTPLPLTCKCFPHFLSVGIATGSHRLTACSSCGTTIFRSTCVMHSMQFTLSSHRRYFSLKPIFYQVKNSYRHDKALLILTRLAMRCIGGECCRERMRSPLFLASATSGIVAAK